MYLQKQIYNAQDRNDVEYLNAIAKSIKRYKGIKIGIILIAIIVAFIASRFTQYKFIEQEYVYEDYSTDIASGQHCVIELSTSDIAPGFTLKESKVTEKTMITVGQPVTCHYYYALFNGDVILLVTVDNRDFLMDRDKTMLDSDFTDIINQNSRVTLYGKSEDAPVLDKSVDEYAQALLIEDKQEREEKLKQLNDELDQYNDALSELKVFEVQSTEPLSFQNNVGLSAAGIVKMIAMAIIVLVIFESILFNVNESYSDFVAKLILPKVHE